MVADLKSVNYLFLTMILMLKGALSTAMPNFLPSSPSLAHPPQPLVPVRQPQSTVPGSLTDPAAHKTAIISGPAQGWDCYPPPR